MEIFNLEENETVLAIVILFDDGQVVVKWQGKVRSLVIHASLDEFKSISVTGKRCLFRLN